MAENKIELKSVNELLGMNFFIPSYQRGYRWTDLQIENLLNYIFEFSKGVDGDSPTDNHILLPPYATDGSLSQGNYDAMHTVYRRNHSRDSPSDKHGTLPSDTLHQMVCCGPQEAIP